MVYSLNAICLRRTSCCPFLNNPPSPRLLGHSQKKPGSLLEYNMSIYWPGSWESSFPSEGTWARPLLALQSPKSPSECPLGGLYLQHRRPQSFHILPTNQFQKPMNPMAKVISARTPLSRANPMHQLISQRCANIPDKRNLRLVTSPNWDPSQGEAPRPDTYWCYVLP